MSNSAKNNFDICEGQGKCRDNPSEIFYTPYAL